MKEIVVSGLRSGRPKEYEEVELEALLDEDSCQTQKEQYDGQYFE